MPFLPPNQKCQNTEGKALNYKRRRKDLWQTMLSTTSLVILMITLLCTDPIPNTSWSYSALSAQFIRESYKNQNFQSTPGLQSCLMIDTILILWNNEPSKLITNIAQINSYETTEDIWWQFQPWLWEKLEMVQNPQFSWDHLQIKITPKFYLKNLQFLKRNPAHRMSEKKTEVKPIT